jgi:hypothetical protein
VDVRWKSTWMRKIMLFQMPGRWTQKEMRGNCYCWTNPRSQPQQTGSQPQQTGIHQGSGSVYWAARWVQIA